MHRKKIICLLFAFTTLTRGLFSMPQKPAIKDGSPPRHTVPIIGKLTFDFDSDFENVLPSPQPPYTIYHPGKLFSSHTAIERPRDVDVALIPSSKDLENALTAKRTLIQFADYTGTQTITVEQIWEDYFLRVWNESFTTLQLTPQNWALFCTHTNELLSRCLTTQESWDVFLFELNQIFSNYLDEIAQVIAHRFQS